MTDLSSRSFAVTSRLSAIVITVSYFVLAAATAYAVATSVILRTGNPYDISNVANKAFGWNPETNYVQVIIVVVLTPLLYLGLRLIDRRKPRVARVIVALFGTAVLTCVVILPATSSSSLDPFHWGEQLAPAKAFINGVQAYTDIYSLHGIGEDVWRPAVGFLLFSGGHASIGAYVLTTAITKTLGTLAFFLLLAYILRSKPAFLVASLWFAASPFSGITYDKNLLTCVGIALAYFALRRARQVASRLAALAGIGVVTTVGFLYSIDVGSILLVMTIGLAVASVFFEWSLSEGLLLDRPRRSLSRFLPSMSLIGGLIVSQAIAAIALGGAAYSAFLRVTFIEIPRYQGLTWDYPLPSMDQQQFIMWMTVVLTAVALFGVAHLAVTDWKSPGRRVGSDAAFALVLLVVSIVYLRFAVGRPDLPHFYVSTTFTFVTLFVLARSVARRFGLLSQEGLLGAIALTVALLLPFSAAPTWQLFVNGGDALARIRLLPGTVRLPDSAWIPQADRQLVTYLKDHTTSSDGIYVVEPEPMLYYFTGLKNPTRFFISWYTDPKPYSEEVIRDLKADPPKYIVLDTHSPWAITDGGVKITQRFPEVMSWISQNYPKRIKVGKDTLLAR